MCLLSAAGKRPDPISFDRTGLTKIHQIYPFAPTSLNRKPQTRSRRLPKPPRGCNVLHQASWPSMPQWRRRTSPIASTTKSPTRAWPALKTAPPQSPGEGTAISTNNLYLRFYQPIERQLASMRGIVRDYVGRRTLVANWAGTTDTAMITAAKPMRRFPWFLK